MSIQFSNSTTKLGIVERARKRVKLDSVQFPIEDIVASANDHLNFITGYAIGADKRFQWDNTNHTALPEGTVDLEVGQTDYSFLTDEQGNSIITLTGVSVLVGSQYVPLKLMDKSELGYDINTYGTISGTPSGYDKVADGYLRLDFKPVSTVANGLKFHFQRTASYYTSADTTKETGVSPLLDKGFVIAAALDCAENNNLSQLNSLRDEMAREQAKIVELFNIRNQDAGPSVITPRITSYL